ncbi:MAG: hypothetical protein E2577_05705, partial [Starkeya sp.]|nr:hypothetical protein [Starkeya sp.]
MKPVRLLTAATLLFSAVTGAFAQEAAREMPGTDELSRISGGTYTVDPDHTQIVWTVDHMGITPLAGMFGASAGTLVLDPSKPDDAKLEVTIPMAGLRVTSQEFATHLASPDLLDTAKFP